MEFFNKAKAIKLRSHLDKYLVADDDLVKVHQSRNGSSRKAKWVVELVEGKSHRVRLKSCHGRYLTATDTPFLLGMTGNRVDQADMEVGLEWKYEWEPIRDEFQVKLRSWCGKYLRGNGGTPPWRNSITHDDPSSSSATQNWIVWGVEAVELPDKMDSFAESVLSSFASDEFPSSESMKSSSSPPSQNSTLQATFGSAQKIGERFQE